MTIKQLLQESNEYFVQKIINGGFIITDIRENSATIEVGEYSFTLWYSEKCGGVSMYGNDLNTMNLSFKDAQKEVVSCLLTNAWQAKERDDLFKKRIEIDIRLGELDKEF